MRWSLGKTSLDLFIPIRVHSERLQLHWIRSHQSLEQFCREFGRSQVWRWWANGAVDKLAGDHANQDRDLVHEEAIAASDKDTQVLQRFLAERVALLFSYDKDQGPQVFFEGEVATLSKNSRPTRLCRKTLSKSHKKSQRTSPVEAEQGPNKRELFRAAVANPPLGHAWAWTSERENGGRIKCTRCQLGVQQIHNRAKVERMLAQPCLGHSSQELFDKFWSCHSSHDMQYEGIYWRCSRCKCSQHTGADVTSQRLREPCQHSKKKKKPAAQGSTGLAPPAPKALFFPQPATVQLPSGNVVRIGDSTRPKAAAIFGPVRAQTASTLGAAGAAKKEVLNDAGVSRSSLPTAVPAPPTPKPSELRVGPQPPVKPKATPGPKQTKLCFGATSSR